MLVREQLQRLGKGRAGGTSRLSASARKEASAPMNRVRALAAQPELGEEELKRTIVCALLAEQLGDKVAQDPGFQIVLDDIYRIITDDDGTRSLLSRAADQLKRG